jgi:muramoyltetrapeptide carboxypeptidase
MKKTDFDRGIKGLERLDFDFDVSSQVQKYAIKNQQKHLPFLAGSDELKIQEFLNICNNPKANWLLATRGGYGCLRLLKLLDKIQIERNHPFQIWGYSDLTVLQLYFWQRKNWPYVQGPLLGTDSLVKPGKEEIKVYKNIAKFGVFPSQFKLKNIDKKQTVTNGEPLMFLGGNLASLVSMLGTPWEPRPGREFVLFLEDIDEAAYKIDRLLTQLKNSRFFETCRAVVLGHFTKCPDYLGVFKAFSTEMKVPVFTGIHMGHQAPRIPLLLGKEVVFEKGALRYYEAPARSLSQK